MKYKLNFWDYVFYTSLLVLSIWVLLKITGIIQTPIWLEYGVPVFSIIFTTLAFYKNLLDNIKEITIGLATLNVKFTHLDGEFKEFKKEIKEDISELKEGVRDIKHSFK